jgi:hypothetical protein
MEYLISGGLLVFFISGLIALNKQITDRPTFKDVDRNYKKIEVCDEIHKSIEEKLSYLPEIQKSITQIETKMDILLKNNGH